MYPVLRRRNFALLWLGGLISAAGDWLLSLALPFYVYQHTGSVLATGILFMLHILPGVLFGSLAGVLADRWDRRRTMLVTDVTRAIVLLGLIPLLSTPGLLWLSYPIVAVEASISQVFWPAQGALLPRLVAEDELLAANALNSVSDSVLRLTAPALGGALYALSGLSSVVLLDSGSYLFSALMVALLRVPKPAEAELPAPPETPAEVGTWWGSLWRDWRAGVRVVQRDALLATVFLVASLDGLARGLVGVLLYVFVQHVLRAGSEVVGAMVSATGIGTLLTGLVLGKVGQTRQLARLIVGQEVLLGVAFLATFSARSVPLVVALSIPVGIGFASAVGCGTLLQTRTAERYRGRVLGAFGTTVALSLLAGEGLATLLGNPIGVLPLLYTAGGVALGSGLVGLIGFRQATGTRLAVAEQDAGTLGP
jgi:MFS family permease